MLVLTMRLNEKVMIGDTISVRVSAIEPPQAKLAIEAPEAVLITRGELLTDDDPTKSNDP